MRAVKKINNNVAVCIDGNKRELIAFGKGIGFKSMPYEIEDLSLITRTFYRIDRKFYEFLGDIPEEIFEVSAMIVDRAQAALPCSLNPNLIIGLADHINFAIVRLEKYKDMKMLFSYDIEHLYPKETELGRYARKLVKERLSVTLPESEITSIAMHFINAEEELVQAVDGEDVELLIGQIANQIEHYFSLTIDRRTFNYNRFAMHVRYYLKRLTEKTPFTDDNAALLKAMKAQEPEIYECTQIINNYINQKLNTKGTEDEIFYLMIHIKRILKNTN